MGVWNWLSGFLTPPPYFQGAKLIFYIPWAHGTTRYMCQNGCFGGVFLVCQVVLTICYGLSVFVLHKNDTNSCKLVEIRTKFVRNSCEFRTKFVTTTFTVHFGDEIRTKFVRNLHEFRKNLARISYEFRTNFVRISYHFCRTLAEEPHQHHLCNNEVPKPTHISLYLPPPPRHTHTHTNTHTHRHTHTPMHKHTHTLKKTAPHALDPHPHTARSHTLIRTWTVDVPRLDV